MWRSAILGSTRSRGKVFQISKDADFIRTGRFLGGLGRNIEAIEAAWGDCKCVDYVAWLSGAMETLSVT